VEVKRGTLVTVAIQGDFGKGRPALVVQSDLFANHASVTVLLVSSALVDAPILRINVAPSLQNGLNLNSQIQIDKMFTVRTEKLGNVIGELEDDTMISVNRAMLVFLGLA
jgi:mRNA interferase MazF